MKGLIEPWPWTIEVMEAGIAKLHLLSCARKSYPLVIARDFHTQHARAWEQRCEHSVYNWYNGLNERKIAHDCVHLCDSLFSCVQPRFFQLSWLVLVSFSSVAETSVHKGMITSRWSLYSFSYKSLITFCQLDRGGCPRIRREAVLAVPSRLHCKTCVNNYNEYAQEWKDASVKALQYCIVWPVLCFTVLHA